MIEIVNSTSAHVRELSRDIRERDKQEAIAAGLVPHRALFYSFRHATYRKTALVDGRVAAMWGVVGSPLGVLGQPYLVTGSLVEEVSPLRFAKIYRKEVEIMKNLYSLLENYVDARYESAIKMLKIAGFTLSEPMKSKTTDFEFRKFSLRGSV